MLLFGLFFSPKPQNIQFIPIVNKQTKTAQVHNRQAGTSEFFLKLLTIARLLAIFFTDQFSVDISINHLCFESLQISQMFDFLLTKLASIYSFVQLNKRQQNLTQIWSGSSPTRAASSFMFCSDSFSWNSLSDHFRFSANFTIFKQNYQTLFNSATNLFSCLKAIFLHAGFIVSFCIQPTVFLFYCLNLLFS